MAQYISEAAATRRMIVSLMNTSDGSEESLDLRPCTIYDNLRELDEKGKLRNEDRKF